MADRNAGTIRVTCRLAWWFRPVYFVSLPVALVAVMIDAEKAIPAVERLAVKAIRFYVNGRRAKRWERRFVKQYYRGHLWYRWDRRR